MTYQTRMFAGVFVATSVALGVAMALVSMRTRQAVLEDTEARLLRQARLASELVSAVPPADPAAEAARLSRLLDARVTLVAGDGRVLGDSEVPAADLAALDPHDERQEIVTARSRGAGVAIRASRTTNVETMYAAVPADSDTVAFVRVALPLTVIDERLAAVGRFALVGLGAGLIAALLITWVASRLLSRRLRAIAAVAGRYRAGDFTQPARDYGRDEIAVVAHALDETARELGTRLAETARARAHLEGILTGMAEGVLLVDRDGRLVLANPAVRSLLRLPDPVEGRHYLELLRHPEIGARVERALAGDRPPGAELQPDHDARRTYAVHVVPLPAERDGGAVVVLHDVSDQRRADQIRRDFVANVSHELRTPLTVIRGYVEALLDASPGPDTRRFLDVVAAHTDRMERLVQDLLRLARLDAGQEVLDRTDCATADLLARVSRELEPLLTARRQELRTRVEPGAARVTVDPAKLHDALLNLVENASRYGPDNAPIDVQATCDGRAILIRIADRGPGVPEAERPRIFERFYRAGRSREGDPGGTGLGLAIVRHLVELHGGRVSVTDREGGGAVFTLQLPAPPPGVAEVA